MRKLLFESLFRRPFTEQAPSTDDAAVTELAMACAVTSMEFDCVVVTLGAACEVELALACPLSASTGLLVSAPIRDTMPPEAPTNPDVDIVQV